MVARVKTCQACQGCSHGAPPGPGDLTPVPGKMSPHARYYTTGITRTRKSPGRIEDIVRSTAASDGRAVQIIIEQEPGAAGLSLANHYKRSVLAGYNVRSERPTGPKHIRAQVAASAAENGLLKLVRGPHSNDFLDEVAAFPHAPTTTASTPSPAPTRR